MENELEKKLRLFKTWYAQEIQRGDWQLAQAIDQTCYEETGFRVI